MKNYIYEEGRDPEITSRVQDEAPTASSPQVGITFAINDSLSVFGLYSTGVVPNCTARDGIGDAFEPTKATNYEAGIKFDAWEGRLSGTISAYKIERENTTKHLWWAPSPRQSEINGYNADQPSAAPWTHPGPDSLWYAIRNVENGLQVAKDMFGEAWHATLEAMAAIPDNGSGAPGDGFYDIPGVARWCEYSRDDQGLMGLTREAEANFYVGGKANNIWFPLVNFSDPAHAEFAKAAKVDSGVWGGNWFYTPGQSYFYGDGSSGTGNAPDGSGAAVAVSDEAEGFDISLHFSPIDNLQIVFNFARVERKITTPTYQFVSAPYWPFAPWYSQDGYYGTLGYNRPPTEAYGDVADTTTYQSPIPEFQQAADDTPENSASIWSNYSFNNGGPLQGLSVGLGGNWQDKRQWFTGFTGGGGNITTVETENGDRELAQLWTDERIEVNGYVSYERRINDSYDWRLALNIDNMLNDPSRYGELFAPGVTWRVSTGLTF